jgi:hypothetical protein
MRIESMETPPVIQEELVEEEEAPDGVIDTDDDGDAPTRILANDISSPAEANTNTESEFEQTTTTTTLSDDLQLLHSLAGTYQSALEEKQIAYIARYRSIRQSAAFSVLFMIVFGAIGVSFFMTQGDIAFENAMLLLLYTITSAGFGSVKIPKTDGFLAFLTAYLFIGISALAILVRFIARRWNPVSLHDFLTWFVPLLFSPNRWHKCTNIPRGNHRERNMLVIKPRVLHLVWRL